MGEFDFEEDQLKELIQLVKANKCLYNVQDENYGNYEVIRSIWRNIAKKIGKSSSTCSLKWKELKCSYYTERNEHLVNGIVVGQPAKICIELAFLNFNEGTLVPSGTNFYKAIMNRIESLPEQPKMAVKKKILAIVDAATEPIFVD